MTNYGLKQICQFAVIGTCITLLVPQHFWLIFLVVITAWVAISMFQSKAFHDGLKTGYVQPMYFRRDHKAFSIAPDCPNRWAVKRHIRMFF